MDKHFFAERVQKVIDDALERGVTADEVITELKGIIDLMEEDEG